MSEEVGATAVDTAAADGLVRIHAAGQSAAGEFRCRRCGYGVAVRRTLPVCPMCGGLAWKRRP